MCVGKRTSRNALFSDDLFKYYSEYRINSSCISAEILSLCDSFCLVSREFYFDRSPRIFENILGLYRKGELHLTESVCPKAGEIICKKDCEFLILYL